MRVMIPLLLSLSTFVACDSGDDGTGDSGAPEDTNTNNDGPKTFEDFITVGVRCDLCLGAWIEYRYSLVGFTGE